MVSTPGALSPCGSFTVCNGNPAEFRGRCVLSAVGRSIELRFAEDACLLSVFLRLRTCSSSVGLGSTRSRLPPPCCAGAVGVMRHGQNSPAFSGLCSVAPGIARFYSRVCNQPPPLAGLLRCSPAFRAILSEMTWQADRGQHAPLLSPQRATHQAHATRCARREVGGQAGRQRSCERRQMAFVSGTTSGYTKAAHKVVLRSVRRGGAVATYCTFPSKPKQFQTAPHIASVPKSCKRSNSRFHVCTTTSLCPLDPQEYPASGRTSSLAV